MKHNQQSSEKIAPFILSSFINVKPQESLQNIQNFNQNNNDGSRGNILQVRSVMSMQSSKRNKRAYSNDKIHGLNEESKVINEIQLNLSNKDFLKSQIEEENI